jgi:hypothetical protein
MIYLIIGFFNGASSKGGRMMLVFKSKSMDFLPDGSAYAILPDISAGSSL